MGTFGGAPPIINDNLIFLLDVNNQESYVSGSTYISDVSPYKSSNVGQLFNNVSYESNNTIKSLNFDGTDDYIRVIRSDLNGGSFSHPILTVCVWLNPSSTSSSGDNNFLTVENSFEFRFNNRNNGYASLWYASNPWAWVGENNDLIKTNTWSMFTYVHNTSYRKMYVNTTEILNSNNSGNIQTGNGGFPYMTIGGRYSGTSSDMKGKVSIIQMYNRVLSFDEITQNYNALKGRFNL